MGKSTLWTYRLFSPDFLIRATLRQHGIPVEYTDLVKDDLLQSLDPAFMRHYMDELSRWQLLERLDQPLSLVVGEREPRAAFTFARKYLARYPYALGRIVPGARHAWSLQFPYLFAALVRAVGRLGALPVKLKILSPK